MKLKFATRPSALARWQTDWVIQALKAAWPELECETVVITTRGDRVLDRPLPEIGGKGLFTEELEAALLAGAVDAAVHSLKDLPTAMLTGLTIGAIPPRAEVRDAWICPSGMSLDQLPPGARVGTSSLRRAAQLRARRQDLDVAPVRGNVETRLRKAEEGQYHAVVLAGAGLARLGLEARITAWLDLDWMLPAPGQGALAVQCRAGDEEALSILASLSDPDTQACVSAERAFLAALGGGCAVPVAAFAEVRGEEVHMRGLVAALDGQRMIRVQGAGCDPGALGGELARLALEQGAQKILEEILE